MLDQANRTFICSVVFIDLVGYSKKTVTEQIRLKTSLTSNLSEAIQDIPVNDRIILDTGDGAAISFLGDPEDALFVTLSLREKMMAEAGESTAGEGGSGDGSVRMGINLGPVKLVKDINGHPNIIGDGINVAQRIMSFARPGQIVVSRSYYDVVSNLASEYAKLFSYEGSRTDKHVREHEIYVVGHHEGALQKAKDGMKDRASSTTPNPRKAATATGAQTVTLSIPAFVQDKRKLTMVAAGLGVLVVVLGVLVALKKPSTQASEAATAAAPADTKVAAASPAKTTETVKPADAAKPPEVAKPEPAKPVETAKPPETKPAESKPEAKVVAPAPSAAVIPPAAAPTPDSKQAMVDVKKEGEKALKDRAAVDGKTGDAKSALPATLVFSVQPWGEIYVNGKARGVTPPMKSIKLDPGKYKIEVKNTTFPVYVQNVDVKARDELTVRHRFQ